MGTNDTRVVGTVDLTPSWAGMVNVIMLLLDKGDREGREVAMGEFRKMATLADKYVAMIASIDPKVQALLEGADEGWEPTDFTSAHEAPEGVLLRNRGGVIWMKVEPKGDRLSRLGRECVDAFEEGMLFGQYPYEAGSALQAAFDMGRELSNRINNGEV